MSESRTRWPRYVRFWGSNVDADIDDELRYHLEMRIGDFIAEGHTLEHARDEALRLFGDPDAVAQNLRAHDRRKLRHERRADMMQDLIQDVRYGARKLAQAPRFTAAVAIVLALGIGANTAVFSAIDVEFFRPLPFFEPQNIVAIKNVQFRVNRGATTRVPAKYAPEIRDLGAQRDVFTHVAAYATGGLNLAGGTEPLRATVTFVSVDFFPLLGRMPLFGRPFMYFPMAEAPRDFVSIVARGSGEMGTLIAGIRDAVRSVDASQPVYAAASMEDIVSASVAPRRTNTILLSTFGFLALLLAAIGVYAVLAYGIAQRTRAIGVRVALGAQTSDVIRLVVAHGIGLAAIGTIIGLAAAYGLARFLSSILYDVSVHDPRVFFSAPVLLLGIALCATWLPARRAARVTPMEALREA